MGTFDEVRFDDQCSSCRSTIERTVQFKFGSPDQQVYRVGDRLKNLPKELQKKRYVVEGYAVECPLCEFEPANPYYAIWVERGKIIAVSPWKSWALFWDDLYDEGKAQAYIEAPSSWSPGDIEE